MSNNTSITRNISRRRVTGLEIPVGVDIDVKLDNWKYYRRGIIHVERRPSIDGREDIFYKFYWFDKKDKRQHYRCIGPGDIHDVRLV